MAISKLHELYVMLGSAICGAVLAFVFDIFRALRKSFKFSDRAVAFQDLAYWTAALVIIYCAIYIINYAQIRIYEFLCMGAGIWFYAAYISRFCVKVMCSIFTAIKICTLKIFRICKRPLKAVKCKVYSYFKRLASPFVKVMRCFSAKLTKTTHKQGALRTKFCKFFRNS